MVQPKAKNPISKFEVRMITAAVFAMAAALELRGLMLLKAGKTVFDVPRSWMVCFAVFGIWFCWLVFRNAYARQGTIVALFKAFTDGGVLVTAIPRLLGDVPGRKILARPGVPEIFIGCTIIAVFAVLIARTGEPRGRGLAIRERTALAMLAVLVLTKMATALVPDPQAIQLKTVGCAAAAIGAVLMFLGLLDDGAEPAREFPSAEAVTE